MRPLLLVHGYPFDHTMWDGVVRALGGLTRVLAPDLPGFGKRPPPSAEPDLGAMADDLVAALDRAKVARAVVAGMSMGGYVALALAERAPERVAGLALVDSRPEADTDEARAGRRALVERLRAAGADAPRLAAEAAIPKLFAPGREADARLTIFPREGAARAGLDGLAWALEAMARRPDRTSVLLDLLRREVPVRIVHGTEDRFIPIAEARALAERLARSGDARLVEIAGAGHASPVEAPEATAAALADLVRRVEFVETR